MEGHFEAFGVSPGKYIADDDPLPENAMASTSFRVTVL